MEDSGDADVLSAEALADPAVVAALALCSFRSIYRPDKPAPYPAAVELPPAWGCPTRTFRADETDPSPVAVDLPSLWGCHAVRSEWRIRDNTEAVASRRGLTNNKNAAALRRGLTNSKKAAASRRRPSPMTPLEHRGGSGASESCSEEILGKRSEIGGVAGGVAGPETKVVIAGKRELSVFRIPDSKLIRQSPAKKKLTHPELEAMHQSLLEHRKYLLKELEAKRRSKESLVAKNQDCRKLKIRLKLESRKIPSTAPMPEETHPERVLLPDLNITLVPESD